MAGWRLAVFQPLSLAMFGSPGKLLEAGLHGPGAGASSLYYPLPSTLAGALAKAVAGDPSCDGKLRDFTGDFDDLDCVLRDVLGDEYILRAGLARSEEGEYYVYVGEGLVRHDAVTEYVARRLGEEKKPCNEKKGRESLVYRPRKAGYTGIALKRDSKTVEEGMLYYMELVDYTRPVRLEIILPFQGRVGRASLNHVRLGGEGSVARFRLEESGLDVSSRLCLGRSRTLRLLLVSPALIEPLGGGGVPFVVGGAVASGEKLGKWIASRLLENAKDECGSIHYKRVLVPANDLELSIVFPGWTFMDKPRRPHVIVPAGTILEVEVSNPEACCRKLTVEGVGAHSRLGWGTVVVVPG